MCKNKLMSTKNAKWLDCKPFQVSLLLNPVQGHCQIWNLPKWSSVSSSIFVLVFALTLLSLSLFVSESKKQTHSVKFKKLYSYLSFLCFHHLIASKNKFRLIGLLANVNFDTNLRENSSKNGTGDVSPLAISYFQKVDWIWPKKNKLQKNQSQLLSTGKCFWRWRLVRGLQKGLPHVWIFGTSL